MQNYSDTFSNIPINSSEHLYCLCIELYYLDKGIPGIVHKIFESFSCISRCTLKFGMNSLYMWRWICFMLFVCLFKKQNQQQTNKTIKNRIIILRKNTGIAWLGVCVVVYVCIYQAWKLAVGHGQCPSLNASTPVTNDAMVKIVSRPNIWSFTDTHNKHNN